VTCICGQTHPLASRRVGCLSRNGGRDESKGMEERAAAKTRTIVPGASRASINWEGRLSARTPAPPTFEAATNKPAEGTQQSTRAMTRRIDDASRDRLRSDEWLVITGLTLSLRLHGTRHSLPSAPEPKCAYCTFMPSNRRDPPPLPSVALTHASTALPLADLLTLTFTHR
jgi:hypothetical protein